MLAVARILFLAFVALLPWGGLLPIHWLDAGAQWGDAVLVAGAAAWLAAGRVRQRSAIRPGFHLALVAYVAAASLSLAANRSAAGASLWKLIGIAELAVIAALTADLVADLRVRRALAHIVTINVFVTLIAAACGLGLQMAGVSSALVGSYGDLLPGAYARAQAGFAHPNILANYGLLAWAALGGLDSLRMRRLAGIALALTSALALSRGIVALAVAALVTVARTWRQGALAAALAVAAALLMLALTPLHVAVDPTRVWDAQLRAAPSPRWQAVLSSWETLRERPLFGVGPGRLPGRVEETPFHAHCTPLNVVATLGLPALVAFAALWWSLWRDRVRPTDRYLWGALLALAIDGLALDIEDFRHVWLLFGLAAARPVGPTSAGDSQQTAPRR